MIWPGIEPWSPGPLVSTLSTRLSSQILEIILGSFIQSIVFIFIVIFIMFQLMHPSDFHVKFKSLQITKRHKTSPFRCWQLSEYSNKNYQASQKFRWIILGCFHHMYWIARGTQLLLFISPTHTLIPWPGLVLVTLLIQKSWAGIA